MADRKQKSQQDESGSVQITKVDAWSTVRNAAEQLKNASTLSDNNKAIFSSAKEDYKPVQMMLTFLGNQGLLGKDWTPSMQSKEQMLRLQTFLISAGHTIDYPIVQAHGETEATEKPGFFNQSTANALLQFATRMEALEKQYGKKKLNETTSGYCKKNGTAGIATFFTYLEENAETLKNKDAKKILAEFEKPKERVEGKTVPVITDSQKKALIDAVMEDVQEEKKRRKQEEEKAADAELQKKKEEEKLAQERERQDEEDAKKAEDFKKRAADSARKRAEEEERKKQDVAEAGLPSPIEAKRLRDEALRQATEMNAPKLVKRVTDAERKNVREIAGEINIAYAAFKEKQAEQVEKTRLKAEQEAAAKKAKEEEEKKRASEKAAPADEVALERRINETRERIEAMKKTGHYNNNMLQANIVEMNDQEKKIKNARNQKQKDAASSDANLAIETVTELLDDIEQAKPNADALMARISNEKLKELDELPDSPGKEIVKKQMIFIKKKYDEKNYGMLNNPYYATQVEFFENTIDLWRATKELKQKYGSARANAKEWNRLDDSSKENLPKTIELVDKEWKLFGRGVALWYEYKETRSDKRRVEIEQEWATLRPEEKQLSDKTESVLPTLSKISDPNKQPPAFCTYFIGLGLDTCKFCLTPKQIEAPRIESRKISKPLPTLRVEEPDTSFRTKDLSSGKKIEVMQAETVVMEKILGKSDEVTLSYSTQNKLIMTYMWFSYVKTKLDDGRGVYLIVDPNLESTNKYVAYVDKEGNVFKIDTAKMTSDSLHIPVVLDEKGEPKVFAKIDVDNENEKLGLDTAEKFNDVIWFVRNCCMKMPDNRPVQFKKVVQSADTDQKIRVHLDCEYRPEYKNE